MRLFSYARYLVDRSRGCTGWFDWFHGFTQHDGDTCPIHEAR
jgi:hypothetical protein